MYKGIAGSEGIGIGDVVLVKSQEIAYEESSELSTEEEKKRFEEAVDKFVEDTTRMAEDMRERIGEKESEILMGHTLMIQDPSIADEIKGQIDTGLTAEAATAAVLDMFAGIFAATDDELTKQRAADIGDIKVRLLKIMLGISDVDLSALPPNSVIAANDLTPSMTAGINKDNIVGILTETGGRTSHSAILARALEIPAVLSIENVTELLSDGDKVIVDGIKGECIADPTDEEIKTYTLKMEEYNEQKRELLKYAGKPTATGDGRVVELVGNIGTADEAKPAAERDAEGIGLFRTEFLYMDNDALPSEDEQFEAYKKAALTFGDKPVIIRTLDVGGDKDIPYLGLEKDENPFLGFRAVRFCLAREDVYKPQLRALLRASAFGNIKIMIPLVTCVDEVRAVKELVRSIMAELDAEGVEYNRDIQIGVMIETAAASLIADLLAKEADFFSIGTNDLTQYTMSVDRGNAKVAYLYSVYNPAVLRSIKRVIECGSEAGITVGMCGEAAADPLLAPLLVSFGLDEYSVNPVSILKTRKNISLWTKAEADKVAAEAMSCATEAEVKAVLEKAAESKYGA